MKNLSRKKVIIAVVIVLLILLGIWFFALLGKERRSEITDTARNLFPFGQVTIPGGGQTTPGGQGTIGEEDEQITEEPTIPEETAGPRLRKISDFPTGGFVPIMKTEEQEIPDIQIDAEGNAVQTTRFINVLNNYVRYTDIENGTIYETHLTPSRLEQELLIENFIPNAEYAHFSADGEKIIYQYWNKDTRTPETYFSRLEKIPLVIEQCPFDFSPITLGDDEVRIVGIHEFLNRTPQTRVARTGLNSPGNEASLVTEGTLTAIKNFQSLYQLDIDGNIGTSTRVKMQELCDEQQERISRAAFEALERKYTIYGFFLPSGIIDISMAPEASTMFYLQKDSQGVVGALYDLDAGTSMNIFESAFSEWTSFWNSEETIEVKTKPSYATETFSYTLNADTHRYFKSLPQKKGMTTLPSPDNSTILFTEATSNSFTMALYERETGRVQELKIQTLVDKCVWSPDSALLYCGVPGNFAYRNQYPDVWYQGLESYQDTLWRIDTRNSKEEILDNFPLEHNASLDIETITIDERGDYLYFIDKNTEHLWSYRLK